MSIINIIEKIENNNPFLDLKNKEFNENIIKFGSLLCILNNKPINPNFLFLKIIKCSKTKKLLLKMFNDIDFFTLCKMILYQYPQLLKSKTFKKINKK